MSMRRRDFLSAGAGALAGGLTAQAAARRPNIILILADDVGYSDIGCYGGEVETPHLDSLARGGLRFTNFYNCARCCPSRAALMTGLYPHQAGMGNMDSPMGDLEGYSGKLREDCVTIPEVLRTAGYATLMAGKWHLNKPGPIGRGFQEYYGLVHGFDSCWDPSKYTRLPENRAVRTYAPGQFYSTNAFTDYALDFIQGARQQKNPYFLYLAYNAAHFPLHAPKEVIDKYAALYEQGWDRIREQRFGRMRRMGLIDERWEYPPRSIIGPNRVTNLKGNAYQQNPAWDSLPADRRADLARRMAIYAAMIDVMDRNIGRVLDDLRAHQELDNTLVLFMSDNGACAEWEPFGFDIKSGPDNILHKGADLAAMGQPGSYHSYGSAWANASNTPFRLYKHYDNEGGISTPLIAHWPAHIKRKGVIERTAGHFIDLLPTCAEIAGARYPRERNGHAVQAAEGRSLTPLFNGKPLAREALYWEHEGNRAVRAGNWKLVATTAGGAWELYDLDRDRTEMHNLAAQHPERARTMARMWETWARRTNVLPWPWKPEYANS